MLPPFDIRTVRTLRLLSGRVIEKYKAGGPGWQSRIDQDLPRIGRIR